MYDPAPILYQLSLFSVHERQCEFLKQSNGQEYCVMNSPLRIEQFENAKLVRLNVQLNCSWQRLMIRSQAERRYKCSYGKRNGMRLLVQQSHNYDVVLLATPTLPFKWKYIESPERDFGHIRYHNWRPGCLPAVAAHLKVLVGHEYLICGCKCVKLYCSESWHIIFFQASFVIRTLTDSLGHSKSKASGLCYTDS